MCARRFLILIFILILITVGGAFALYQFGDRVLIRQATPKGHFEPPPRSSGPDYREEVSWIARPGLADDPSQWLPTGEPPAPGPKPALVFYVHPTTYLERDRWNAPLDEPRSQDRAALFVRSQASAFNGVARIWAPRYRQAAFGAFLLDSKDAQAALDLAYSDLLRAFDRFVAEAPADGPIIIAGHSQGALHVARLLRERVAGRPLARRIAAAYVVGWPLSAKADIPAMGLPVCGAPTDGGCILSWLTFREPANFGMILDAYRDTPSPGGVEREREDMVCVNPISGERDGVALPTDNRGTLVPTLDFTSASLAVGTVGAHCERGFLIIDGEIPDIGPYVLPGNNFHVYDYALFWGSIRADAERRLAAWRAR